MGKRNVLQWRLYQQQKFKQRRSKRIGLLYDCSSKFAFQLKGQQGYDKGVAKLSYLNKISFHRYYLLFPSFDSPCQRERGGAKQTEVTHRLWPITTKKCTASFRIPFSLLFYGCEVLSRWHWSLAAGDIVFLKTRGINTYHNYTRRNLQLFRNNRALYGGITLLNTSFS